MNTRLVRKIIGLILTALLLTAIVMLAGTTAAAQTRAQRRVVIVRPIRPFHSFGRRYDPFWDPYGRFDRYNYYRQYVFSNSEKAYSQGYKDGLKTGESDGRKSKSYDPERSHYYHDSGFGNFAEAYRSGFSAGYSAGFRAQGIG
jgi:hypothetical protein